jgi:hypothetical protein
MSTKLCAVLLVLPSHAYHAKKHAAMIVREREEIAATRTTKISVAQKTEEQAIPGVTIKYLSPFDDRHGSELAVTMRRKKIVSSSSAGEDGYWDRKNGEWEYGTWVDGEWVADPSAGDKPPWLKDAQEGASNETVSMGGLRRCGFTWDDAAAKVGSSCLKDGDCVKPAEGSTGWPEWANYSCYTDVPNYMRGEAGECASADPRAWSDIFCQQTCSAYPGAWCDPDKCACAKNSEAWNLSAPIQPISENGKASDLPPRNQKLIEAVAREWDAMPSGLPACPWRPHKDCTNVTQYECTEGKQSGKCSGENWFESPDCEKSCVHVRLLKPAPYYALWIPGPESRSFLPAERQPRYKHDASKLTPEKRGINLKGSDVLMSRLCHSVHNHFVGITVYSPHYEGKASRLVRSCERVGICCKATLLPADAFGKENPEGSEGFRFSTISMKPSFILSQLEATELPVVFLDTDLEFHRFPDLFVPGSWPSHDRDVILFNYWGNETLPETKNTPNIGSAVAFFNTTLRSRNILRAWAQAMAWEPNEHAPDDQVLDLLLSKGDWLRRASFGWLPGAYLRTMPSYYRGIIPVIDHDHGSAPGLLGHGEAKPDYPPLQDMELCDPEDISNKGRPPYLSEEDAQREAQDEAEKKLLCQAHGICDSAPWQPDTPTGPVAPEAPKAPEPAPLIAPTPVPAPNVSAVTPVVPVAAAPVAPTPNPGAYTPEVVPPVAPVAPTPMPAPNVTLPVAPVAPTAVPVPAVSPAAVAAAP